MGMLRRSSTADRDRERDSENVGERKGQSVVGCVGGGRTGRRACGRAGIRLVRRSHDWFPSDETVPDGIGWGSWHQLVLPPLLESLNCINLCVQTPVRLHVHLTMGTVLFNFILLLITRSHCSCLIMAQYLL